MPPKGYTLLELAVGLTVAALLLALAVPGFQRFLLDARLSAEVNAFVGGVQRARSEAVKRARPVVLCSTPNFEQCAEGGDFAAGWMVFVPEPGVRPPRPAPGQPPVLAHSPAFVGAMTSNRALFEFRPFRTRSTNGTVTFCDRRGAEAARAVIVSYTGRPRVSVSGPGRNLTCAP